MHDNDPELIDFSLQQKVVLVLANHPLCHVSGDAPSGGSLCYRKCAKEMMAILANFQDQWDKYKVSMEKIGKRLGDAQKEYDHLITHVPTSWIGLPRNGRANQIALSVKNNTEP